MSRPLFLIGTTPLYGLGAAAAWHDIKAIREGALISGLVLVWLIQLMTHYNNEYCDLETDQATETPTHISGGSRVLVKRLVPRSTARLAAVVCLLLAITLAIIMELIMNAGIVIWVFVGIAVFAGWYYSAKPLRLESLGLGELTNIVVSCFLVPSMSYYLQTSTISPLLLIICAPLGLLTLALILTSEVPDFFGDKATGKKTLVVRIGRTGSILLALMALIAGWLTFSAMMIHIWPFWGWIAVTISIPMLTFIGMNVRASNQHHPAPLERMGLAISMLLGYASICLAIAFIFV